jgi:hypothetical protein|tara:strand:+ start:214 stop:873 length:660 start_codon:yes stop_codon:yes gene_type:complete
MKKEYKVLELFAGSRSIGKVCEELKYEVFCSDIKDFGGIDYVCDIKEFDVKKVPFIPDVLWSSPPCTGFSVAAIGKNWVKGKPFTPKTDSARLGIEILEATLKLIEYYLELNPNLLWYIENPRGKMRKSPLLQPTDNTLFVKNPIIRHTVTYCQYGDERMKPTDIWTNNNKWVPRPMCKNGDPCHVSAPRGSKTGTQGLKNNYERSKIPYDLCKEILSS